MILRSNRGNGCDAVRVGVALTYTYVTSGLGATLRLGSAECVADGDGGAGDTLGDTPAEWVALAEAVADCVTLAEALVEAVTLAAAAGLPLARRSAELAPWVAAAAPADAFAPILAPAAAADGLAGEREAFAARVGEALGDARGATTRRSAVHTSGATKLTLYWHTGASRA
jgi:hypothetical protein